MSEASGTTRRGIVGWAACGVAVHVAIAAACLAVNDFNPQWFVHFGAQHPGIALRRAVLGDVLVPHRDYGHDGQAFWALARDPLLTSAGVVAGALDLPVYRAQRIAYPALASPWRLGGETSLVWGLLVTNLLIVFAGSIAAGALARSTGAPARAALAYALCPGVIAATLGDLSDALAVAALLVFVLGLERRSISMALTAAVVSVLAKEPMLLGIGGVALLAPSLDRRMRLLLMAVPASAMTAWGLYVRSRLGWLPTGVSVFDLPFRGYVEAWTRGWAPLHRWGDAVAAISLLVVGIVGIMMWRSRRSLALCAAVPFLLLIPFLGGEVIAAAINSYRALAPALTLIAIDAYAAGRLRDGVTV